MICNRIFCIRIDDLPDYTKVVFLCGIAYIVELIFIICCWIFVMNQSVTDATHDISTILLSLITVLSGAAMINFGCVFKVDRDDSFFNKMLPCTMITVLMRSYATSAFLFYQGLTNAFVDEVSVLVCLPISLIFAIVWTQAYFGISNKVRIDFYGGMKQPIN